MGEAGCQLEEWIIVSLLICTWSVYLEYDLKVMYNWSYIPIVGVFNNILYFGVQKSVNIYNC